MLLEVEHLRIAFRRDGKEIVPVRDVSFAVPEHGRVALVGESGCGKSLTALSLARLPPIDRATVSGRVAFGTPAIPQPRMAYVFQNPMESLNPVMRIRDQLREALPKGLSRRDGDARIVELLARTGLPDPVRAAKSFPCELSGGQQQRAMIAMALAARPDLLIADEPTTALDVTTQREVLELIDSLAAETGMAVLLITHNLGLVAGRMDTVNVIYTRGLLAAVPALDAPRDTPLADIPGTVPPPDAWPDGCAFAPRCSLAMDRCRRETPPDCCAGARRAACFAVSG